MVASHTLSRTVSVVLLVAAVAGCAAFGGPAPEAAVSVRATEHWKARIALKHEEAYAFTTPAYRAVTSARDYRAKFGASAVLQNAEVNHVTCEPQKCTVQMKVSVKPLLPFVSVGTIETYVDQTWLYEQGQWWLYQEI